MKWILVTALALSSVPAFAADMSAKPMKLMGYISDSKCAAAHNSSAPDAACVKKCIGMGAKPVFVDDAKKEVWSIDNPDTVANDYGKKVTLMATADSSAKTIHITKVDSAKDAKGSSGMMDDMKH
ncbi:MAG: hypothetical protein ACR2JE_11105 [Acidobacteriaceae bacterium]